MRSNFLLILGLCAGGLQQTVLGDVCYQKDKAPVELDVVSNNNCVDLEGNIYSLGLELLSCCDCFRLEKLNFIQYKVNLQFSYKCEKIASWDNHLKVRWVRSVSAQCCQTCNGTVAPPGTLISTTQLEDDCLTTQTEVCRLWPGLETAVIDLEFSYRNCCNDNTSK